MSSPPRPTSAVSSVKASIWSDQPLQVVSEIKISDLLGDRAGTRLEASGVCGHDGAYYVIFDNTSGIARITDLAPGSDRREMLAAQGGTDRGFEDITFDPVTGHFYVLIEAVAQRSGVFMAVVQEHDLDGRYIASSVLDFPLPRVNKGLEGLTCLQRDGRDLPARHLRGQSVQGRRRGSAAGRGPHPAVHAAGGASGTTRAPSVCPARSSSSTTPA